VPIGHQLGPALGERRRRRADVGRLDDCGDDQLPRRLRRRQRRRERSERPDAVEATRGDQQRSIRRRRLPYG
jgi:hypothetical protein